MRWALSGDNRLCTIIKIAHTTHESVKFEIFERLNTGAVTLSSEELRNCIYRGPLNDLIKELAVHPSFKRVLSLKQSPIRMVDSEMVLRFLAFNEKTYLNYPGKMKAFMNDFMKTHQHVDEETQNEWREKLLLACDNAFTIFGESAFRRFRSGTARDRKGNWEGAINKALFDSLMFWTSRYEKRQVVACKDSLRERLIELMVNEQEFIDSITLGTSDVARVKTRFDCVHRAFEETIEVPSGERRTFSLQDKVALFEADPTCAFCHQRIESLDDADVDHRTRFSEGGATHHSNARIAHRYCNRASRQSGTGPR